MLEDIIGASEVALKEKWIFLVDVSLYDQQIFYIDPVLILYYSVWMFVAEYFPLRPVDFQHSLLIASIQSIQIASPSSFKGKLSFGQSFAVHSTQVHIEVLTAIYGMVEQFIGLGHLGIGKGFRNSQPILQNIQDERCSEQESNLIIEDQKVAQQTDNFP